MSKDERVVYGDSTVMVQMDAHHVYFSDTDDNGYPTALLNLSRAQMDEIVRGYEREKEQERDGR